MKLELDEGFQFGLGVFETIAVRKGRAVFLEEHLARMNASMEAGNSGKSHPQVGA